MATNYWPEIDPQYQDDGLCDFDRFLHFPWGNTYGPPEGSFGGDMTIEQFRENAMVDKDLPKKIETEPVREVVIPIYDNQSKMKDIKSATGKNETLRLKRGKPLKRNENNLESVLGLVIKTKT